MKTELFKIMEEHIVNLKKNKAGNPYLPDTEMLKPQ